MALGKYLDRLIYLFCAVFVVGHWLVFFKFGKITFLYGDWPKEQVFYTLLKDLVSGGTVPFHIEPALQGTNRFFGLPETVLSPQIFLLRFLDIGSFVMVNTIIMSLVGLLGLIAVKNTYRLNIAAFLMLFFLFEFNGYIVSHNAQGHSMWNGYFMLPFFVILLRNLTEQVGEPLKQTLWLSLCLFAMNLQGSFHLYIWCAILMALAAIFQKEFRPWAVLAIALSAGLSFFRLGTAAFALMDRSTTFYSGYPSVLTFLEALMQMQDSDYQTRPGFLGKVLGWWEYDYYIGIMGVVFLAVFAGFFYFRRQPRHPLSLPLAILTFLSFNSFYQIITLIPVPLSNSERVSARFIVVVLTFVMVFAAEEYSRFSRQRPMGRNFKLLACFAVAQTAVELAAHSRLWSLFRLEKDLTNELMPFKVLTLDDPVYIRVLQGTTTISAVCLVATVSGLIAYGRSARLKQLELKLDRLGSKS